MASGGDTPLADDYAAECLSQAIQKCFDVYEARFDRKLAALRDELMEEKVSAK